MTFETYLLNQISYFYTLLSINDVISSNKIVSKYVLKMMYKDILRVDIVAKYQLI